MNRIIIAVNLLLGLVPSLLGAQGLQQKIVRAVELRVLVCQTAIRSKAGSVAEIRFIPQAKSKKSYQVIATLEIFGRDGIILSDDMEEIRYVIPWSVIRKLEIKHERKSKAEAGAVIGLLVGGTAGGIIGSQVRFQFCVFDCSESSDLGPLTGLGIAVGSLGGLIVGTTVGAVLGNDSWEKLPLDQQVLEKEFLESF
jgi:hypothetical protein